MRPMIIHTSHEQRRRSSVAQVQDIPPHLTKQDRPALLRRRSTLATIDQVGFLNQENRTAGEVRRPSVASNIMPRLLQRSQSSWEKKTLSRVDSCDDLRYFNLVVIGLFVVTVCVIVVIISLLCKQYFQV